MRESKNAGGGAAGGEETSRAASCKKAGGLVPGQSEGREVGNWKCSAPVVFSARGTPSSWRRARCPRVRSPQRSPMPVARLGGPAPTQRAVGLVLFTCFALPRFWWRNRLPNSQIFLNARPMCQLSQRLLISQVLIMYVKLVPFGEIHVFLYMYLSSPS